MEDEPARNDATSRRHIVMIRGKYRGSDDKGTKCAPAAFGCRRSANLNRLRKNSTRGAL